MRNKSINIAKFPGPSWWKRVLKREYRIKFEPIGLKQLKDTMSQQDKNDFPLQNLNNNLFTLISAACSVEENDSSNDGLTPLSSTDTKKNSDHSDDYDASDDEEPLSKMRTGVNVAKVAEPGDKSQTADDPVSKQNAGNQGDNR